MSINKKTSHILKDSIVNMPIGIIATMLGFITMSNVFGILGINSLKHVSVHAALIIIFFGFLKLFLYPKKVHAELNATVGASVYPTLGMTMMLIGSYYIQYNYIFGKTLWFVGIIIDALVLILFVYYNIIKKFDFKHFLPSCFVPFVGPIVATISSPGMNEPMIAKTIFYFSFIAYFILLPIFTYRLWKHEVHESVYPMVCIMAAPPSLCLVAYVTLFNNPNLYLTSVVYAIIVILSIYMYSRLPIILSRNFAPSFAGITFPLAISTLATFKFSIFLGKQGFDTLSIFIREMGGLQLAVACAGILFVIYKFSIMFFEIFKENN